MDTSEQTDGLPSGEQPGQSSEESNETSSQEARTYSPADIEAIKQKAGEDALSHHGRESKKLTEREEALKANEAKVTDGLAKIEQWNKDREEEELAAARGDPVKLRQIQEKRASKLRKDTLDKREADLNKREADLNERANTLDEKGKTYAERELDDELWAIAAEHGIPQTDLKDRMKALGLTTVEQAKSLAAILSGKEERPSETPEEKPEAQIVPASGKPSSRKQDHSQVRFDKSAPSAHDMISSGLKNK